MSFITLLILESVARLAIGCMLIGAVVLLALIVRERGRR